GSRDSSSAASSLSRAAGRPLLSFSPGSMPLSRANAEASRRSVDHLRIKPRCISAKRMPSLCRDGPFGQVLANLALDPLERVVDGLAVTAQFPPDLLVGVAVEVEREHP